MYELKCFNEVSSITVRYKKEQYHEMIKYAESTIKNFNMKFEFTDLETNVKTTQKQWKNKHLTVH